MVLRVSDESLLHCLFNAGLPHQYTALLQEIEYVTVIICAHVVLNSHQMCLNLIHVLNVQKHINTFNPPLLFEKGCIIDLRVIGIRYQMLVPVEKEHWNTFRAAFFCLV